MNSVLYDAPGPRDPAHHPGRQRRRRHRASCAGVYVLIYRPLAAQGQFTMEKWGPLIDPGNKYFGLLWARLGVGFRPRCSPPGSRSSRHWSLGTGLAILRVQLKALQQRRFTGRATPLRYGRIGLSWLLNGITRAFVEVFRGLPVVITIFFASALPRLGLNLGEVLWYLVIGLTLYNMVVIGEILRSGMEGLPGGQREAASSLGLSSFQTTRDILLPQAFRIMLPALISQLVVVLKDTSLGFIISYEEILRVSGQAIQILNNPIQMYAVVGAIYIVGQLRPVEAGRVPPTAPGPRSPVARPGADPATVHSGRQHRRLVR